jgi:hypothetical protein
MPISPLRRGRVLNLTSCRSMRQQHRRSDSSSTDTQQTLTLKSLLRMPISIASNRRSNPCDVYGLPCGDCSASTLGLFPWVMFWVMIGSKLGQVIGPQNAVGSSSFTRTFTVPFFRYKGINLEIGMSRKRKPLPPRHKRLTRQGRLQAAKTWLRSYPGKNIARGYRKHFGVDSLCRDSRITPVRSCDRSATQKSGVGGFGCAEQKAQTRKEIPNQRRNLLRIRVHCRVYRRRCAIRYHHRGSKIPHQCGSFVFRRNALYVGRRYTLLG